MKFSSVPLALLVSFSPCAFSASSGTIEGRLAFSLTDLRPDDAWTPYLTIAGPVTYRDASLQGQPVATSGPGFAQGPFGEAKAEVFGDWQFKASGYETGVGDAAAQGTSFSARALYYVVGTGMTLSPRSTLTLTGTFTGGISIAPGPKAPTDAYVWTSLTLQAPAIPAGGLAQQTAEAFISEHLSQRTPAETSFADRVITVSITNASDFELPIHYSASINVGAVSYVPEPGTWALMLMGALPVLGLSAQRRRKQAEANWRG